MEISRNSNKILDEDLENNVVEIINPPDIEDCHHLALRRNDTIDNKLRTYVAFKSISSKSKKFANCKKSENSSRKGSNDYLKMKFKITEADAVYCSCNILGRILCYNSLSLEQKPSTVLAKGSVSE